MKKVLLILLLIVPLSSKAIDFKAQIDSLEQLLASTPRSDAARRLELLNNLMDIDLCTGKRTHIMDCFEAAVEAGDVNSIDDIVLPLALSYSQRGDEDSTKLWMDYSDKYLPAQRAECNREYMQLMSDIKKYRELDELAKRMIDEQIKIDSKKEPFRALRVLYTLGTIAAFRNQQNSMVDMKDSDEYYKEGFRILDRLDFEDGIRFRMQYLVGSAGTSLEYGKMFVDFVEKYYSLPHIKNRKFYSHRMMLIAYERMLYHWESIPREELDYYYNRIKEVLKEYPNDAPSSPTMFLAKAEEKYFHATGQRENQLNSLDTLIDCYKSQGIDYSYYYYAKVKLLGELGRYKDGYNCAAHYVQLKDSLFTAQSNAKMEELRTQYDVDKLEQEKENMRQRLIFYIILSALLLLFVAGLLVGRNILKKKNRVLLEQLKEIAENYAQTTSVINSAKGTDGSDDDNSDSSDSNSGSPEGRSSTLDAESVDDKDAKENQRLFKKVNELIINEKLFLDPDLRRDAIVNRIGTNKNKLNDAINSVTGNSFVEYITDLRLKESLVIIKDGPDTQLADVAVQSGFGTYSTFYRAFYKKYGVRPTDYRNHIQASPAKS